MRIDYIFPVYFHDDCFRGLISLNIMSKNLLKDIYNQKNKIGGIMERLNLKLGQWFVTCIDTFMSGWGHAEGKTNKLIFLCDNEKEAEIVADNAEDRSDQRNVQIHSTPPTDLRYKKGTDYETNGKYVQIKTKKDYPTWYKEGSFRKISS
jgi:hypothetical protein